MPSANDIETDLFEVRLAIQKCIAGGYKTEEVKGTGELIRKILPKLPEHTAEELIKVFALLVEHANENKIPPPPPAANFDTVLPTRSAAPLSSSAIYDTSLVESKKKHQDNLLLIYSPFAEELDYLAECYASKSGLPIRTVDMEYLITRFPNDTTNLIYTLAERAASAKELIIYKNIEAMADSKSVLETFFYYLRKIRQTGEGVEQLILSTDTTFGIESKYREYMNEKFKTAGAIETYLKSIPFDFLTPPPAEKAVATLRGKFEIIDGSPNYDALMKSGIFLGWRGLDAAMREDSSVDALLLRIDGLADARRAKLDAFIDSFKGAYSYNLAGWKYIHRTKKKKTDDRVNPDDPIFHPKYTMRAGGLYDALIGNDEIYAKMEKLMNYEGIPLTVKCAWAVDFALRGGDQLNIINIPPEDASKILTERWNIAYRALVALLRLDMGTLLIDITDKDKCDGLCCNGGATIRLHKHYLDQKYISENLNGGIETLLHEMFHALQHRSILAARQNEKEQLGYYLVHFGIRGRIKEWETNHNRYRSYLDEATFADYYDQVFEADARIFASDCLGEYGSFNHPRLDG